MALAAAYKFNMSKSEVSFSVIFVFQKFCFRCKSLRAIFPCVGAPVGSEKYLMKNWICGAEIFLCIGYFCCSHFLLQASKIIPVEFRSNLFC
jgi:hypothetical protein